MCKKCLFVFYLLTITYASQKRVNAAPYYHEDHNNAIIVIPFKPSENQITKIESFKIDGQTAVQHLTSRVSAEKILRTLSNVPEFSILVEGLDAITLGDVYKAAFPNGILYSIGERFLRTPTLFDNKAVIVNPHNAGGTKSSETPTVDKSPVESSIDTIQYDEVNEDDQSSENDDLKEEPITDDYVYDQPIEDRFHGDREYVTKENDDSRSSKNVNLENEEVSHNELGVKDHSKYGENFRNWINKFLAG